MKLIFFGSLTDIAGKTEFDLAEVKNTHQLKNMVFQKYPEFRNHSFVIAVNKKIIRENVSLSENDVVAFMPPFSGG